jgi:hypothetical protein
MSAAPCVRVEAPRRGNGTWRSLVAHLTGGQGVVGSNPAVPTKETAGQGHCQPRHPKCIKIAGA